MIFSFRRSANAFLSSFPRRRESICFCVRALIGVRPCWVPSASWRPGHFLCLHKESNQRNAPSVTRRPQAAGSLRSAGVWRQGSCPVAKCGPSWPAPRAGHAASSSRPSPLHRGVNVKSEQRRWVPAFAGTTSFCFCGRSRAFLLLYPGPLQVAASRWRKSRAAIAARMAASSSTVHGRIADEPRSLLA